MSDKKQNRHQKPKAPALTPEQQAERERIELYGKNVQTMSHRQLRRELYKSVRREYAGKPPQPQAGLTIALGTVLLSVLDNTRTTPVTDDGRRLRKDQINPTATKSMNPGW